jgi:hypothetical protein
MLTFAQAVNQHDLPFGKLQRIVMDVGLVDVDLPEPSYLFLNLPGPQARQEAAKDMVAFHLFLERQLGAGK